MSVAPQIAAKTPAAGGNASGAAGSSFYAAMRLMPKPRREAMFAIYDFCRSVDDIADEPGPTREERRSLLDGWRADVASLYAGTPPERVAALSGLVARYGLDQADFLAVIDGMQMDVEADIRAPNLRDARSLLRPRRQRGWPAVGAGVRHASASRASNSPTISAARCSSPISCAISTKTAPWAAFTCRARRWPSPASPPASPRRSSPTPDDAPAGSWPTGRASTTRPPIMC